MRLISLLSAFTIGLTLAACTNAQPQESETPSLYPVGDISPTELKQKHSGFFHDDDYQSNEQAVAKLAMVEEELEMVIYFGLWCHDSQREVPRMLKLLERSANSNITYRLIALDLKKSEPKGRAKAAQIVSTPTFVLLKQGKEIGRIVETPEVSLAQDLLAIIQP